MAEYNQTMVRLDDERHQWLKSYAESHRLNRAAVLVLALDSFRSIEQAATPLPLPPPVPRETFNQESRVKPPPEVVHPIIEEAQAKIAYEQDVAKLRDPE